MVFRAKNADGSWAPLGNGGFLEGSAHTYGFDEPQDAMGLADLYGDAAMTAKISAVLSSYAHDYGFNDYVTPYGFLPIFSNSPSTAQNIVRTKIIPTFHSLVMWEDGGGGDMYYTHNAGEIVLDALGLYPYQSPGATWAMNSPAVTTAVVHGIKEITIQANNNSSSNMYVSSIRVNRASYPSHFISGETFMSENTTITLNMVASPAHIGNMYITGTSGEILSAHTDNSTFLRFQNDPLAPNSRAKIYATRQPISVTVNGTALHGWTYHAQENIIDIKNIPAGTVLISFSNAMTPAPMNA